MNLHPGLPVHKVDLEIHKSARLLLIELNGTLGTCWYVKLILVTAWPPEQQISFSKLEWAGFVETCLAWCHLGIPNTSFRVLIWSHLLTKALLHSIQCLVVRHANILLTNWFDTVLRIWEAIPLHAVWNVHTPPGHYYLKWIRLCSLCPPEPRSGRKKLRDISEYSRYQHNAM